MAGWGDWPRDYPRDRHPRRPLPEAPLHDTEFEFDSKTFPRGSYVRIKSGPFRGRIGQVLKARGQTDKPVLYVVATIDNGPRVRIPDLKTQQIEHIHLTPLEILAYQALPDEEEG